MRKSFLTTCFILFGLGLYGQSFSVLTWNIKDLGRTKDADELAVMVDVMKDYDLILIQEVVAKDPAGAQKVAQIADLLNRKGSRWDYRVSLPTKSPSSHISERYAYLWKTANLRLIGRPYLDRALQDFCYREPFIAEFKANGASESFFVVNYHSRKYNDQPEEEIKHFHQYPSRLESQRVIIAGDFNLDEKHEVWEPLKRKGFRPALFNTPTTLKQKCDRKGHYFNYPIDNIYFSAEAFRLNDAGRVDFVGECAKVEWSRGVSDHLPVFVELE